MEDAAAEESAEQESKPDEGTVEQLEAGLTEQQLEEIFKRTSMFSAKLLTSVCFPRTWTLCAARTRDAGATSL